MSRPLKPSVARLLLLPLLLMLLAAVVGLLNAAPARAELQIDITRGNVTPLPVAIPAFFGLVEEEVGIGQDIADVITADLLSTGLFKPIDRRAFIQSAAGITVRPRFADWRLINAQALVSGSVSLDDNGMMRVEFRLWDIFAEAQMLGRAYQTEREHWRRVAHIIADAVYKRLTGEDGYFDSRIVYVAESGPATERVKRLAIMDQDGANHRFLTDGRNLVLTPRFSPARQEITYLSYHNDKPQVFLFNLQTGRQEVLGAFDGMTFAPRFSPDGNSVLMSHAEHGNSDIYIMDLRTRIPRRLTTDAAADLGGSFSPDGAQIAFESDRGGTQQLYVMDADGSNQRRISFGGGRYGTPVWSPRGDLIAFTKLQGGQFYIGVMHPDGSGERLLAGGYHNEAPSWSPNGRVLMFFSEDRNGPGSRLHSIDLTGHNQRVLVTPGAASDPAWSPLNP